MVTPAEKVCVALSFSEGKRHVPRRRAADGGKSGSSESMFVELLHHARENARRFFGSKRPIL